MTRNPPRFLESPHELPPNLSHVLQLSPSAMTLGLGNIHRLLEAIDHPERAFRSITVAGTNGKGSVTAYLAAILHANGIRVGRYSSPHVYDVTERVMVAGEPAPLEAMEAAAARIVPLHDAIGYSYFEALTAIAFLVFAEQGVEFAVLETGLGGRFDATNAVDPVLTIITSIALDHRRILGDTLEEILREKLGITRPGVPLLTGRLSPELAAIVERRAGHDAIPLWPIDRLGRIEGVAVSLRGTTAHVATGRADYGDITLPFMGRHQADNTLLAIGAAEMVLDRVPDLGRSAEAAAIPGRFEIHAAGDKTIVLDVAHNDAALLATCEALAEASPREDNAVVIAMLRRKELTEFPARMGRFARRYYIAELPLEEAARAPELLAALGLEHIRGRGIDVALGRCPESERDWDATIEGLLSPSNPASVVLVTGSHRTVEVFGRELGRRGLL